MAPSRMPSPAVAFFRQRYQAEGDPAKVPIQQAHMKTELQFHGVLREVSKKRPELVHAFVAQHANRLSSLTRREATKHLG